MNYLSSKRWQLRLANIAGYSSSPSITSRVVASTCRRASIRRSSQPSIDTRVQGKRKKTTARFASRKTYRASSLLQTNEYIFIYRVLCIGEIFRETEHEMSLTWKHRASSYLPSSPAFHPSPLPRFSLSPPSPVLPLPLPRPLIIARSVPALSSVRC